MSGRVTVADVKSKASRRTVTAPQELLDVLAEHLARTGRRDPADLLFADSRGGPLRRAAFRQRVWLPAVERAGVDGLTFHGLRHSAAGFLIAAGAHPRLVQVRMGHSSIRTTFDVYGSLLPEVDEQAGKALGAVLRARGEGLDAATQLD